MFADISESSKTSSTVLKQAGLPYAMVRKGGEVWHWSKQSIVPLALVTLSRAGEQARHGGA